MYDLKIEFSQTLTIFLIQQQNEITNIIVTSQVQ